MNDVNWLLSWLSPDMIKSGLPCIVELNAVFTLYASCMNGSKESPVVLCTELHMESIACIVECTNQI